jgi:Ca-activated chloride channel family protein
MFVVLCGCEGAPVSALDGGNLGVSPGGADDNAEARQRILDGQLPHDSEITVEGFLSEHDIPLPVPPNAPQIYANVAAAWRKPFNEPAAMGEVFIGLGTTQHLDTFEREPQNLVVVLDLSASMYDSPTDEWLVYRASDYVNGIQFNLSPNSLPEPDWTTKLDWARSFVSKLLDQLDENDQITVVAFQEQPRVLVETTAVTDRPTIRRALDRAKAGGDTDMFAGLKDGVERALRSRAAGRLDRVLLLTDAIPNAGQQDTSEFLKLVGQYAEQNVGMTLLGIGRNFNTDLALAISALRGGNLQYIDSEERIDELVTGEFRFFVSPAAYELVVELWHDPAVAIRDVYGVRDYYASVNNISFGVPTLFFSKRQGGGALVIRMSTAAPPDFSTDTTVGTLVLRYKLPDGTQLRQETALVVPAGTAPSGEPPYFSDSSARRAALLLDTVLTIKRAISMARTQPYVYGQRPLANLLLRDFLEYFDEAALGLSNKTDTDSRSLSDERAIIERLIGIIR